MSNLQWSGILCHAVSQVLEREREREREREIERERERAAMPRHRMHREGLIRQLSTSALPLLSRHRN